MKIYINSFFCFEVDFFKTRRWIKFRYEFLILDFFFALWCNFFRYRKYLQRSHARSVVSFVFKAGLAGCGLNKKPFGNMSAVL